MCNKKLRRMNMSERGNALFLILIAVALFAALSYAITQSGRGGGTVDKEQALITAGQIVEYPATLRTAVTRMIITGTPGQGVGGIDVSGTTLTNELFSASGGGASDIPPPPSSSVAAWTYVDASVAVNGFYVKDVGTNADTTGREVLAVLQGASGVSLTVCQQINKGLGQASPYTPGYLAAVVAWATPGVNYAGVGTLTGAGAQAAYVDANPFSCISNATTAVAPYIYYHALVEQ